MHCGGGIRQSTSDEYCGCLNGSERPAQESSTYPSGPGRRASCSLTEILGILGVTAEKADMRITRDGVLAKEIHEICVDQTHL